MSEHKRNGLWMKLWLLLTIFFVTPLFSSYAKAEAISEYVIKVKFIHNFIRFTRWPTESEELKICIYGKDPFGLEIDKLNGKIANQRKITITRTQLIEEAKACDLVFLNIQPPKRHLFERALTELREAAVLTVSDANKAADYGVMIELNITKDKVAFRVNHTAAKNSDLNISAKLLRLAREVI